MKNLFKMVEKHFAKSVFSILCFLAVVSAISCNNSGKNKPKPQKPEDGIVIVKVGGTDDYVVGVEPKDFTLQKGTSLGLTQLQEKMKITFKDDYELAKITYGSMDGVSITDEAPYTFNENSDVFISSQVKSDELALRSLKIGGANISVIAKAMNAGKVNAEKVRIEATFTPKTAKIEYKSAQDPQPEASGEWTLNSGKNTLTITLKQEGKEAQVYTVDVERVDVPILKKLIVGSQVKEAGDIANKMTFAVKNSESSVEVKYEVEPKDAKVVCEPALEGDKLSLAEAETKLTIKIGEGEKVSTYEVVVNKISVATDLVDIVAVVGGRYKGKETKNTSTQSKEIIEGGKNVVIDLCGDTAYFSLFPKRDSPAWKSVTINGNPIKIETSPDGGMRARGSLKLGNRGTVTKVDIVVDCNENGSTDKAKTSFGFAITRMDVIQDIPLDTLLIRERDVIGGSNLKADPNKVEQTLVNLQSEETKPHFSGAEPTLIELQCRYDVIKTLKIDNEVVEIKTKTDSLGPVFYVEKSITGVAPNGKSVHVLAEPKDAELYAPLNWYFVIDNTFKQKFVEYDFYINNTHRSSLEEFARKASGEFKDKEEKTPPTIDLQSNHCNIKFQVKQQVKSIKINGAECETEQVTVDGKEWTQVRKSIPITTAGTDITILVEPKDTGAFKNTEMKFKAKGIATAEKMKPKFKSINGDVNLSKAKFLDKLADTSNPPTHRVLGSEATFVISLTQYEYEFLCEDGVYFDGKKVDLVKEGGSYILTQKVPVNETTPKLCKVEFKSKSVSESITWQFNLQGGGSLPSYPMGKVEWLKLNDFGGFAYGIPKSFKDKLLEATGDGAVFTFDGNEVTLEVGYRQSKNNPESEVRIKEVVFDVTGKTSHTVQVDNSDKNKAFAIASHKVEGLTETNGYKTTITIKPEDTSKYSELKLHLTLKPSGKKVPPPLKYYVDTKPINPNEKREFKNDSVEIKVRCSIDEMNEVYIGKITGTSYSEAPSDKVDEIKTGTDENNRPCYDAVKRVTLSQADDKFIVRVKPKDTTKYDVNVDAEFTLKEEPLTDANKYSFARKEGVGKDIDWEVKEWVDGVNGTKLYHYGAKKVSFTARTKDPNAEVKWCYADMVSNKTIVTSITSGADANGYYSTTHSSGSKEHKSGDIMLFTDKPTYIRVWVKKGDGAPGSASGNGQASRNFNYVSVKFAYNEQAKTTGYPYKNSRYGTVVVGKKELDKADEKKDEAYKGKVSLCFEVDRNFNGDNADTNGCTVANVAENENAPNPGELVPIFDDSSKVTGYKIWIDVKDLTVDAEKEIPSFIIKKGNATVFEYKLKIKLVAEIGK